MPEGIYFFIVNGGDGNATLRVYSTEEAANIAFQKEVDECSNPPLSGVLPLNPFLAKIDK